MNLADELRVALSRALDEATRRRHEFLTLEHVLLALLHDPTTADVLKAVAVDVVQLENDLTAFLESEVEKIPEGRPVEPQQTPARPPVFGASITAPWQSRRLLATRARDVSR